MMKRLLLVILSLMLSASLAYSAGSCTDPSIQRGKMETDTSNFTVYGLCTADAASGSFPAVPIGQVGGYLMSITIDPGSTAPLSGAFDVAIYQGTGDPNLSSGIDLLGGAGADIVTAGNVNTHITPLVGEVSVPMAFSGPIVLQGAENTTNSATFEYYIKIDKGN